MALKLNGFCSGAALAVLTVGLSAQAPTPGKAPASQAPGSQAPAPSAQAPAQPANPQSPTFRVQIDAVTMDVVVKDGQGRFVPDLKKEEFEVYEDGVKQEIASMTMSHGGRVTNVLEAAAPPPPEGIILPPIRRVTDTSGRIFLFFIDDLHLQFQNTARVRDLFKRVSKNLLHEGDLFGLVSSGPSSIAVDMTYDRKRFEEAINRMTGSGLKPSEIIQTSGGSGSQGPAEVRYNAHVAFSTMREALDNLEKVRNRRKAIIWVSEGYDFSPFLDSRMGRLRDGASSPFLQNDAALLQNTQLSPDGSQSQQSSNLQQNEQFSDAELTMELAEITRAANRANTTIYTIDPRGLVAGGDIAEQVDPQEWNTFLRKTQDSVRVLAEQTGGIAVVNQNDFDKALKNIDAASSDYYVLGYYSSNPDPTKRRRQIEVKVTRPGMTTFSRKEYVLKPPKPSAPAKPAEPPPSKQKR
jgi:VWFA-related protein